MRIAIVLLALLLFSGVVFAQHSAAFSAAESLPLFALDWKTQTNPSNFDNQLGMARIHIDSIFFWKTGEVIITGNLRYYGGTIYSARESHTSDSTNEPGVGSDWTNKWTVSPTAGIYAVPDLSSVITQLKAGSEGRKAILLTFGYSRAYHPDDRCRDASGTLNSISKSPLYTGNESKYLNALGSDGVLSGYSCPWFENFSEDALILFRQIITQLKAGGVTDIDYIIFDIEGAIDEWSLTPEWKTAILGDPRWSDLKLQLDALATAREGVSTAFPMTDVFGGSTSFATWLDWDAKLYSIKADAINVIFNEFKAEWPDIKGSNYGFHGREANDGTFDPNGHPYYQLGVVGTHASGSSYGWIGWQGAPLIEGDDSWHILLYEQNKVRGSIRAGYPIQPWIAYPTFADTDPEGVWKAPHPNPFWQENIRHLLLSGADPLLYWNANNNDAQDQYVEQLFEEMNLLIGIEGPREIIDSSSIDYSTTLFWTGLRHGNEVSYRVSVSRASDSACWSSDILIAVKKNGVLSGESVTVPSDSIGAYYTTTYNSGDVFIFSDSELQCSGDTILCGEECVVPVCLSNSACDDSNSFTVDSCLDAGACDAACVSVVIGDCAEGQITEQCACIDPVSGQRALYNSGFCCGVSQVLTYYEGCNSDVDCFDGNPLTADRCNNPGSCESSCVHDCSIECVVDFDCDDSDGETTDSCLDANTCSAICSNIVISLCGNGVVDSGETCSSCPLDVSCGVGLVCQSGSCVVPVTEPNNVTTTSGGGGGGGSGGDGCLPTLADRDGDCVKRDKDCNDYVRSVGECMGCQVCFGGACVDGNACSQLTDDDSDGDSITDEEEGEQGTNPLDVDSDNDFVSDGQELKDDTDPLDANSNNLSVSISSLVVGETAKIFVVHPELGSIKTKISADVTYSDGSTEIVQSGNDGVIKFVPVKEGAVTIVVSSQALFFEESLVVKEEGSLPMGNGVINNNIFGFASNLFASIGNYIVIVFGVALLTAFAYGFTRLRKSRTRVK